MTSSFKKTKNWTLIWQLKILPTIFYGLDQSPFVLWRINISHCEKHLFSISKNFFFLTFSTGSRSWKFFRKKDPFWVKNVKTLWDFSHWWVEPPEKRKNSSMMMRLFKNPFRFFLVPALLTWKSGVCHSFREIARISLSVWKTGPFFSNIFFFNDRCLNLTPKHNVWKSPKMLRFLLRVQKISKKWRWSKSKK